MTMNMILTITLRRLLSQNRLLRLLVLQHPRLSEQSQIYILRHLLDLTHRRLKKELFRYHLVRPLPHLRIEARPDNLWMLTAQILLEGLWNLEECLWIRDLLPMMSI